MHWVNRGSLLRGRDTTANAENEAWFYLKVNVYHLAPLPQSLFSPENASKITASENVYLT